MFADVLLAPEAGQVTSQPWPQCQPWLNQETELVLSFLWDPSPAWLQHGGQGWLEMQGCSRVSPWGTCGELPVSHELLEQGLESVLVQKAPVLLDPAPGEPGGHPSTGWPGRHPAGMRALWVELQQLLLVLKIELEQQAPPQPAPAIPPVILGTCLLLHCPALPDTRWLGVWLDPGSP